MRLHPDFKVHFIQGFVISSMADFSCLALFRSCFGKSRESTISFCASDNLALPDLNMLSSSCLVAIPVNQRLTLKTEVVIHSTKMTGNFSLKLNWFGQTGKVSKKVVHLERWTSFLGWTGLIDQSIDVNAGPYCLVFSMYK